MEYCKMNIEKGHCRSAVAPNYSRDYPAYCFEDARRGFLIYLLMDIISTVNTTRNVKNS